ncbi:NUDIX domain-containing protein [Streptosporangium roseum]|uniref:Nudix hydrolase domain-containing protein n=1 Tax=Streptosporangium roseum (strain ATCC 12428 / DSM 43021 / JCM 3005 / KCTC 9067 / NCIMB 10171 / NRRL 2505 / NI 9100) TaxID=479432 RepID=D2B6D4_STRRD|nr:NUDIX domain-containing protein [Streptosporangium roseum]ACZ85698.1 hypothetical protein Sros_2736 [Streptosporangium roseum DSM 43021]
MGELIERVDEQDRVLEVVERAGAVRRQWMHRIATTICRDPMGQILVLRRAEGHVRFPGHHDVMVGGAVAVGESYEDAAARELVEELGAGVPVRFLFKFLCQDGISPVWFGVHEALIAEPFVTSSATGRCLNPLASWKRAGGVLALHVGQHVQALAGEPLGHQPQEAGHGAAAGNLGKDRPFRAGGMGVTGTPNHTT